MYSFVQDATQVFVLFLTTMTNTGHILNQGPLRGEYPTLEACNAKRDEWVEYLKKGPPSVQSVAKLDCRLKVNALR